VRLQPGDQLSPEPRLCYEGAASVDRWLGYGSLGWTGARNAYFVFVEAGGEDVEEGPDMGWREGVGFELTMSILLASSQRCKGSIKQVSTHRDFIRVDFNTSHWKLPREATRIRIAFHGTNN